MTRPAMTHARWMTVVALVALSGCSGGSPAANPTPGPTGGSIPGSPSGSSGSSFAVRSGTMSVTVTGDERFAIELPVSPDDSRIAQPPGSFSLVFRDADDNLVSLGGETFYGTRPTSGDLAVSVVFNRTESVIAHNDVDGGCRVTLMASEKALDGSVSCPQVEGGRYAVDATFRVVTT